MRIEENAMDHPKFTAINANAWRLWCEGGTYCQKHLTDGFIPSTAIKGFRYYSPAALKMLLAELVPGKGPLWHEVKGGYQVHDYLHWNEPRDKVLEERQKSRDRYERWRRSKGTPSAAANGVDNAAGGAEKTELNRTEHTKAAPQRPARGRDDPRRRHPLDEPDTLEPWSMAAFDRLWACYPRPENKAKALEAWRNLRPEQELAERIIANVEHRRRLGWATEVRFVPLPARYLNERMWEDTFVPRTPPATQAEAVRHVPDADQTADLLARFRAHKVS